MKVKCEKYGCKNIDECGYCSRDEIILEDIRYIESGVCYHYEKNISQGKREEEW
jgi:hypothetical protein